MPVTRRACPTCHHSLCLTQELPARVKCMHCGASFIAAAAETAAVSTRRNGAYPVAAPFAPPPAAPEAPSTPAPPWLLGAVLGGAALFVLLGVALLLVCLAGGGPEPEGRAPTPPTSPGSRQQYGPTKRERLPLPVEVEETPPIEFTPPAGPPPLTVKIFETVTIEKVTKARALRLAVSPVKYDNIGLLLNSLGAGYQWTPITEADLRSSNRLADFDVVFFTCASTPVHDPELAKSLRAFVQKGGTLYASDLRFTALQGAFPEFIAAKVADLGGRAQEVSAHVVDGGLREALGADEIKLKFDAFGWKPASFDRAKVTTFLEGWYRTAKGAKAFAPLLVRFACGKGTVIFTSFHNSKQNSATELKLLRYLVFTAITAEIERKVETTMISSNFAPAAARRSATSPDEPQVTQTYTNKRAGPLRFALGFADQGATLRLTLVAPDGRRIAQEGKATFTIEVENAPAGEWRYAVTALQVPFPNFPFTLTVGAPSK